MPENAWIKSRLRGVGKKQVDLARALGLPSPRITEIIKGERRVQIAEIEPMANLLQMDLPELAKLLGVGPDVSRPPAVTPQTIPPDADLRRNPPEPRVVSPRDLPIYGAAEGGDGSMILDNEPIEYADRPPNLFGVRGAYGVYVVNESMAPAYEQGDKIHIHPGRPLKPGKDTLFIAETDDGTRHALVKRLLRVTDRAWKVQQFNPAKTFDLPKSKWQRAFRIVGSERAD